MNILLAVNAKYLKPAMTLIQSLYDNEDASIHIYMLHSSLSDNDVAKLKRFTDERKVGLTVIKVNGEMLGDMPLSHHFSIETYYRFFAQSLLPDSVDRILWMDSDMIVNRSIGEFYNQSFDGNLLCVCESINKNPKELLVKLELPLNSKYFNAGIILFDLKAIRESIDPEAYFDYIRANREKITWLDQDVLNVFYNTKSKFCPTYIYNNQFFSETVFSKEELTAMELTVSVYHYIGAIKPWQYKYENDLFKLYWKYALKSEGVIRYFVFKMCRFMRSLYRGIRSKHQ